MKFKIHSMTSKTYLLTVLFFPLVSSANLQTPVVVGIDSSKIFALGNFSKPVIVVVNSLF